MQESANQNFLITAMTGRWFCLSLSGVGIITIIDRLAKFLSTQHQTFSFDAVLFVWQYSLNHRLALSLPGLVSPQWWGIVGLLVAGGACWYTWYKRHTQSFLVICAFALGLGAASNGYDRLFRGGVVDYLAFDWLNGLTLNLADILITIACVGIIWWSYKINKPTKT